MSCRSLISGLLAVAVLFSAGCGKTTMIGHAPPARQGSGARSATVVSVVVSVPPGLDPKPIQPRDEQAMVKARLSLESVLATLVTPAFLTFESARGVSDVESDGGSAAASADGEPPLAAQRFYMRGRQDWLEDRNFEAIDSLSDAYEIAPTSAAIARLLGIIHIKTNRNKATQYLAKAVQLEPTDAESLFFLGNHALRQGRWEQAVVMLARALDQKAHRSDLDPAIWPLVYFDLAVSLEYAGYDQAAIRQFTNHLEAPRHLVRASPIYQRLYALSHYRGSIWRRIGDAHLRLDQPAMALRAYQQANPYVMPDRWILITRLVYTHLRLGRADRARDLLVSHMSEALGDRRWLILLEYLVDNGVQRANLARLLRRAYRENDQKPEIVLAIATLLAPNDARALFREHLSDRPGDAAVFGALIGRILPREDSKVDLARAAEAMAVTATLIEALPAVTNRYMSRVLDRISDLPVALAGIDRLGATRPTLRFLRGTVLARLGRSDEATIEFYGVIKAMPSFKPALVALAKILVGQEKYTEAERLLDQLTGDSDPVAVALRVEVLDRTERTDQALELLGRLIETYPANVDLVLRKANLQIRLGEYVAAEYLMLDRLNVNPQEERLYEALFHLYETYKVPDVERQFSSLVHRALREIPQSWIARLKLAQFQMAKGGVDANARAEQLFRQLMVERPRDLRPLGGLLDLLWRTQRGTEGNALIDQRIQAASKNPMLLQLAQQYYLHRDRKRFHEVSVLFLISQRPSESRAMELGYHYLLLGQPARVIEQITPLLHVKPVDPDGLINLLRRAYVDLGEIETAERKIRDAITRFSDHHMALMMQLAIFYDQTNHPERAEKVMFDILEENPDHAQVNNMLGYHWAVRGVNLERARVLIDKALADDPANSAYRDSLGWVYYKMGRFEDAVRELRRARQEKNGKNPIILDHLGDAYYQVGNSKQAQTEWKFARQLFHSELARLDSELEGLDVRLQAKVAAVGNDTKPSVAEVSVRQKTKPRKNSGEDSGEKAVAVSTEPYTVGEKESLFSIAAKLFGSPKLWVAIAKVNPDIKFHDLAPGQVIRVPTQVQAEFENLKVPDGVKGQ